MCEFIKWCNVNNGFLTGLMSLLTIIVSIIAVIVSIKTARLPYKKKLKLSCSISILFSADEIAEQTKSSFSGVTINAINIGNRNICIQFLGFAIKERGGKLQKLYIRDRELGGIGILSPTEISTVEYTAKELHFFQGISKSTKVYCYAYDSEGKEYKLKYGRAGKIVKSILQIK